MGKDYLGADQRKSKTTDSDEPEKEIKVKCIVYRKDRISDTDLMSNTELNV